MSDTARTARSADVVLETEGLTKQFGGLTALEHVDLAVERGELHAIIGPNGAGKTTLFNTITGALEPTAGTVWFDGEDVTEMAQEKRPHRGLARSFQSNQLFADLSVLENVRIVVQTARSGRFGLDLLGNGRAKYREQAFEYLERVGLDGVHTALAKNLSHGDQRRLGIAISLATDPSVLLLDEPTSGMGPTETQETAEMIDELRQDLDLTVLLIEHDMDIVLSMSDRITVLNQGEVLATDSPGAVQENEDVQNAYLGGMREEL
ncbi:amino acid/amide ABC transporter ATP-binding protein 1, HAAT family [Halomicrobium zhouii]|uniref:Probable branched-chain amino acid transport ATP-binding protein LivG n=1 Tax=Halomicrobium zhouii TaxID=767519 RepID=A0A1I6MAF4_9EURY|nr:ABC transporter ATP-binding protein [Halomicrobium zhouii]SFS12598.1 amino acid/amide ABC transporter ATP-binding protein 1, HAAT family [Halomicrobium zhouii]